jgi:hypothetical protein
LEASLSCCQIRPKCRFDLLQHLRRYPLSYEVSSLANTESDLAILIAKSGDFNPEPLHNGFL